MSKADNISKLMEWLNKSVEESKYNLSLEVHGNIGFWSEMARLDLSSEILEYITTNKLDQ